MAEDAVSRETKTLSASDAERLERQNARKVSDYQAAMLERNAKKHWDLFYKRNETRFFKDRHWTTREFEDLLDSNSNNTERILFEIGCGVGNFIYPLSEENPNFKILACDLSSTAVEIAKSNPKYNPGRMHVFQCDITSKEVFAILKENSVDVSTLIFVLSAIHPERFAQTLRNVFELLKPGGVLLFRDYGLYDMAQLRFKAGHKISENFYMRQDGTRAYYFSTEYLGSLLEQSGFRVVSNTYVHRRTINKKENVDVPRIFVQCKASKPI
ncbi:unnamed protein product [Phyllotreta striolata]|uniref:tRNA N(3)-methylcytidine methyltransferase n=1 Tax=Phyllotreta striolata TaxID=444603 RepID=A0A9N9TWC7_PHYSR|nr:unnamed protein product [Phyllotreta striolata]